MANISKSQLIERAKTLGLKVGNDWTYKHLKEAIEIAETEAEIAQEDTDEALGEIGMPSEPEPVVSSPIPEPPVVEVPPVLSSSVASEPIPPVPAPPSTPLLNTLSDEDLRLAVRATMRKVNSSSKPRIGAGRYQVLWTVTLPSGPVHSGEVTLNDVQARSLVAQGAVIHVDDYPAYVARNAATKVTAKPAAHPAKIPSGAGRYRTVGGVMRNGKEIPHGTVADFTAAEVANLTKPGMVALEYAD